MSVDGGCGSVPCPRCDTELTASVWASNPLHPHGSSVRARTGTVIIPRSLVESGFHMMVDGEC